MTNDLKSIAVLLRAFAFSVEEVPEGIKITTDNLVVTLRTVEEGKIFLKGLQIGYAQASDRIAALLESKI